MTEILFQVETDPDGGLRARSVGVSIHVEANSADELRLQVRDAIECHFDDPGDRPKLAHLHFVHDEIMVL